VKRDDICRGETVRGVVGFERLASELFNLDAAAATKPRELSR